MSTDNTDARRGPSRDAKAAAGGMEITEARVAALRAVRDQRVTYDADQGLFFVDGKQMVRSERRTYGEIRRFGHVVEARGTGVVDMKLTATGEIIVDDADKADAEYAQSGEQG